MCGLSVWGRSQGRWRVSSPCSVYLWRTLRFVLCKLTYSATEFIRGQILNMLGELKKGRWLREFAAFFCVIKPETIDFWIPVGPETYAVFSVGVSLADNAHIFTTTENDSFQVHLEISYQSKSLPWLNGWSTLWRFHADGSYVEVARFEWRSSTVIRVEIYRYFSNSHKA